MNWDVISQSIGVAVSGLISWGIVEGIQWIRTKTAAAKYQATATKIENLAEKIVIGLLPEVEKEKLFYENKKLPAGTADIYRDEAAKRISSLIGSEAKHLVSVQGPALENYLRSEVERALRKVKLNGSAK